MRFIAICLLLLFPVMPVLADAPLVYSKTSIRIIPSPQSIKSDGKQEEDKQKKEIDKKAGESNADDLLPSLHRVTKEFMVEVRPLSFLDQHDFMAHQPFTDKEGMMMLIDSHTSVQLKSSNLLGKVDVLFVLDDGVIERIAPELVLPELAEPLTSDKPIRAFIFLKDGMVKQSDIRPGDSVEGAVFKTRPVILQ